MFDRRTECRTHFIAVFATFKRQDVFSETLIAIEPFLKKDDREAHQHIAFLKATL